MHALIQKLTSHGPVVTDGAWGTELQSQGLAPGQFPEVWNLSHPERVAGVARAYVQAGSQIILTNTFGANRIRLNDDELAGQAVAINRMGVKISRGAAEGRAYVFASIGPTGRLLMPDETNFDDIKTAFDEQADALAGAGADGLVIETMTDLREAAIAVAAAHRTGLPVVGCMVFDSGKDKDRTMTGVTPEQAAEALAEAGADVIGINCGQGIASLIPVCRRLHAVADRPIWLKPNAGLPVLVDGRPVYRATPEAFALQARKAVEAGASFIGGCCGTSPAFIMALKLMVQDTIPMPV